MSTTEQNAPAWQPNPFQRNLQRIFAKSHIWMYQTGGQIG